MKDCKHFNFESYVKVGRTTEDGGDPEIVKHYMADIIVKCSDCGLPFEFMGLPMGMSFWDPMVSADRTEARMPIQPSTDPVEFVKSIQ